MIETRVFLWDVTWTLTCGHTTPVRRLTPAGITAATPRRTDHSFGAMRCPTGRCGRRRVVLVSSYSTGLST